MDFRVDWSPESIEDLESISEYIARDSEYYARSVVSELIAVSRKVGRFARIGRMVPEVGVDEIRESILYSYRLIYRIEDERILIVAIIHSRRLLTDISDRLE